MQTKILFLLTVCTIVFSCCQSKKSPENIVVKYFNCNTTKERLAYVADAKRIQPVMENRYKQRDGNLSIKADVISTEEYSDSFLEKHFIVTMKLKSENKNIEYYVVNTKEGYKIDWEASVGYNEISVPTFNAISNDVPTKFRTYAQLDNSYSFLSLFKNNRNTHWCLELRIFYDALSGFDVLHGIVEKNSYAGNTLFKILKDGKSHKVTLLLTPIPNNNGVAGQVFVEQFICEGWFDIEKHKNQNTMDAEAYFKKGLEEFKMCGMNEEWHRKSDSLMNLSYIDFSKAIDLNPKYGNAYLQRGSVVENIIYFKENEVVSKSQNSESEISKHNINSTIYTMELALRDYNKSIELQPDSANGYLKRGFFHYNFKNYQNALKDFNKYIELDPNNAEMYYYRGELKSNYLGDEIGGKKDIEIAEKKGFISDL